MVTRVELDYIFHKFTMVYGGNVHDYATTKGVPCGHHTHMTFSAAMGVEPTQTFAAK